MRREKGDRISAHFPASTRRRRSRFPFPALSRADSINDAEAKRRGVSVEVIQLEHAKERIATLEKQVAELQAKIAELQKMIAGTPATAVTATKVIGATATTGWSHNGLANYTVDDRALGRPGRLVSPSVAFKEFQAELVPKIRSSIAKG